MEASWNLCTQPIILSKNSNPINDARMPMTPLTLDALNSSPNSIDEKQFVIPQRRASASYEVSYLNSQHHQYSVQGSTSTPNSVGLSSGTASPDVSTQHTNDSTSFQHCNDVKWGSIGNDNCAPVQDKSTRYCYVFHGQPPNGTLSTMSDSTSIMSMSNSSAHSAITVPASSILPTASFTSTQPTQALITTGSPFQANSLPAPPKPSPIERPSSVPLQNTPSLSSNQTPTSKSTDFSALSAPTDQKSKKPKKRKSTDMEQNQPVKKPSTTSKEPAKAPSKPQISALTRRRLKTAEKLGEPMEKMHLLLTELTVEDLKIICRKYNLPISGTKSDLLRRLQPLEDQIDVEAILLEAMQEEDRQNEEKAREEERQNENIPFNRTFPVSKFNLKTVSTTDAIPTVKIPVTACNGSNQFDVAISNYLLQNRKQLSQQQQNHTVTLKPAAECMDGTCSCMSQKPGFPTTKTIYFAPSSVLNGTAPKTTVIRVPIANFNHSVDSSASSAVLSKKLCKLDTSQCNGPATTFSYAEMGSGGQFTLETTPAKNADPAATMPKFVQISVPSTFCPGIQSVHGVSAACLKCKENQPKEVDGAEELQSLINELSLGQLKSFENSTLTARILGLHQQTIKAQYSKLYQMGKLIGNSQKVLQCQQGKIEAARKAMLKIKVTKPASIDTLSRKLDIAQLKEQHNQHINELKSIQDNHQQLKTEQEKLAKLEFQLQEELSIEQAVEDVVRLIKTNRKTALLIVQLVHKFQCDRMREINRIAAKKQDANNCSECNGDQKCACIKKETRPATENPTPTIVTLDESDDEHPKQKDGDEDPSKPNKSPIKKKSKPAAKRNNQPISQHSDHNFAEIMEDIFTSVISNESPVNTPTENETGEKLPEKLAALIESEERLQKLNVKSRSSSKSTKTTKPIEVEKKEQAESAFAFPTPTEHPMSTPTAPDQLIFNGAVSDSNPSMLIQQSMPQKFERLLNDENSVSVDNSFVHPTETVQTPALYNYMTSATVTKSEINTAYAVNNPYNQQLPYPDSRPTAYHQRRAFLQQKRQTLYEQLEQLERQQLHNEMQNSTYMCNSIEIDEDELTNLGDLNVEDLYNYDFDQLDVPTPIDETPATATFNTQPPHYMHQYQHPQFHNHSHSTPGFLAPPDQLSHNQQQRHYSNTRTTFQHANSVDFEDVLDLIRNGEKNRQPSMDFECEAQATNAIYQDLRLNDMDEMSWNDSMTADDDAKQVAVNEN